MWLSPAWWGRKGRQAGGLVALRDHTGTATTSLGAHLGPGISLPEARRAQALPLRPFSSWASPVLASPS